MKKITAIILASLFFSCTGIPKLQGNYIDKPYTVTTDKGFEEVWTKVIDFYTEMGVAIETIEKASGVIVSSPYSFSTSKNYTVEKKGKLENPNAWVVLALASGIEPKIVTGKFNVRVKSSEGKTLVSVNLYNLQAISNKENSPKWKYIPVASTGNFEKTVAELVK